MTHYQLDRGKLLGQKLPNLLVSNAAVIDRGQVAEFSFIECPHQIIEALFLASHEGRNGHQPAGVNFCPRSGKGIGFWMGVGLNQVACTTRCLVKGFAHITLEFQHEQQS